MTVGQAGEGERVCRVLLDRLLEVLDRTRETFLRAPIPVRAGPAMIQCTSRFQDFLLLAEPLGLLGGKIPARLG